MYSSTPPPLFFKFREATTLQHDYPSLIFYHILSFVTIPYQILSTLLYMMRNVYSYIRINTSEERDLQKLNWFSFDQFFLYFPFSPVIPQQEKYASYTPVQDHCDPDAHHAKAHIRTQYYTHHDPAEPHGQQAYDHGKSHVICCPESIGQSEGKCPDNDGTKAV